MLGQLKYPDDFPKAQGLNELWYKDTTTTAVNADNIMDLLQGMRISSVKCTFSFRIPMKHIFGVCEDYDQIVHGL